MAEKAVTKEQAEAVVQALKDKWPAEQGWSHVDGPTLYPAEHEELPEGCWSVAWEGGPEGWTSEASGISGRALAEDVFLEPIASWCLGIFPKED